MRSPRRPHPPVRDAIAGILGIVLGIGAGGFLAACGGKPATAARPPAPPAPVAIAASPAPPVESICGLQGMPDCPLQGWMDNHLSGPLSRDDYPALMRGFRELAAVAPVGFSGWGAWAQGGEAAADQQDHAAVQKACTGCHDGYRERYRKTLRNRPMPGSEQP
jgi:hypothetical protein